MFTLVNVVVVAVDVDFIVFIRLIDDFGAKIDEERRFYYMYQTDATA